MIAAAAPAERGRSPERVFGMPKGLVVPAALVISAELFFLLSHFESESLAPPTAILVALAGGLLSGEILLATRDTLITAFSGLAIGGTIGLLMGVIRGTFRSIDQLLDVTTESLRPIPSVALIPVLILIFGFGYKLEITCVAFSCTWTVFILTRAAVGGVEPRLLEVARVLRLTFCTRMWKIVIPAALPRIFVAFRLAAGLALIVAVTTEVAANPLGLGYNMIVAEQSLRPALTLAYLVWIGVIGWSLNELLLRIQRGLFGRMALTESEQ